MAAPPPVAESAPDPDDVIIVGAGQSGLAASACLSLRGVRSLVLERDDCVGSLWRKRAYDRLTLHIPKSVSALPHAPHPEAAPTYLPRDDFVRYLDAYAARFGVRTRLRREVRSASYDEGRQRWEVEAVDLDTGNAERYAARFLVVATGMLDEKFVPEVPGIESFPGKVMHASDYKSAKGMEGKSVLVVGCGNSGMEVALDLAEAGAVTSIVVRGELHIITKGMMHLGIVLSMYLPVWMLDKLVLFLCYLVFGNTSKHGLRRPAIGPFARLMQQHSVPPVVDVGTYTKIKSGEIQVTDRSKFKLPLPRLYTLLCNIRFRDVAKKNAIILVIVQRMQVPPAIRSVCENTVEFVDGRMYPFDAIVFATGYRSAVKRWLQVHDPWLIDDVLQKRFPKAENGLYYAGFSGRGIYGSGTTAEFIAEDISKLLHLKGQPNH